MTPAEVALPSAEQIEAGRRFLREHPPAPLTDEQIVTIRRALTQR